MERIIRIISPEIMPISLYALQDISEPLLLKPKIKPKKSDELVLCIQKFGKMLIILAFIQFFIILVVELIHMRGELPLIYKESKYLILGCPILSLITGKVALILKETDNNYQELQNLQKILAFIVFNIVIVFINCTIHNAFSHSTSGNSGKDCVWMSCGDIHLASFLLGISVNIVMLGYIFSSYNLRPDRG